MTEDILVKPPRSRTLRLWLIIGSILSALGIVPAAIMGMMSVMASDAGTNAHIEAFIIASLTFPVAMALGPILAWIAYGLRQEKLSWFLLFAPLAWPVVIVALLIGAPTA